jgi:flavin reductase ActVB
MPPTSAPSTSAPSTSAPAVSTSDFRAAMGRFPSGVTITTTLDASGAPRGFTANAFSSVSLDPPMVLVCLARTAECFPAFMECERFAVSVLARGQRELALRFATRGADKFGPGGFEPGAGAPVVAGAAGVVRCQVLGRHPAGDHVVLLGTVEDASWTEHPPLVYHAGAFPELVPAGGADDV